MADKKNYQATLLLPKTEFPMRAGLAQGEPITLARWEKMGLYQKQRAKQRGKPKYILHDGPPYANGNIHIGHALNKILKDIISRSQNMMGKDSPYVPGWDCHGLPIEWKVEEDLRAQGKNKNDIPVNEFRKLCRDYATKWLNIQREEFKRLGVLGDWDNPYSTMDYKSEAIIAGEIGKVAMDKRGGAISHDFLFKDYRPVMWSIPEQTALAEAEVEYKDVTTRAVYVAFKFFDCNTRQELKDNITNQGDVNKNVEKLKDCEVIIWTTTPWTLPANCAIAFNKNIDYATYDIIDFNGKARRVALAEKLAQEVAEKCKWQKIILNDKLDSNNLTYVFNESRDIFHDVLVRRESDKYCIRFEHPLYNYNPQGVIPDPRFLRQLVNADFVTADAGTGFVHIAPAHGKDDALLIKHMDGRVNALKKDGFYHEFITKLIPELTNVSVYDEKGKDGGANQGVIAALKRVDALVGVENYKHSYPHSWRSKAPIIFLSTPQWFINMDSEDAIYEELEDGGMGGPIDFSDKNSLRQKALQALEEVVAYPANGKSALTDMIANRPDWCISRQRAWGVPLPLFAKKFVNEGESLLLRNAKLFARVREVFEKEGADAWFNDAKYPNSFWLKDIVPEAHYNKYEKIKDVVDVWFDSGSTHAFVLAQRPEFRHEGEKGEDVIADLYLEGTDQHRGWFHSSLLESVATTSRSLLESFETTSESVLEPVATRGRAPYKALLTHGFVLDEKGNKMSKSLGNVTAPEDVIRE
ncbi:MAG: class I tRNA ligase family protein, partial [Hydrotalea sp.]|nr:class I tRNA ligase family protein [Hydrotalea sp.]